MRKSYIVNIEEHRSGESRLFVYVILFGYVVIYTKAEGVLLSYTSPAKVRLLRVSQPKRRILK